MALSFRKYANPILGVLCVVMFLAVVVCTISWPRHFRGHSVRVTHTGQSLPEAGADASNETNNETNNKTNNETFVAPLSCVAGGKELEREEHTGSLRAMEACMATPGRGWCTDRHGKGKCVPGELMGPNAPTTRCQDWWFQGMCLMGPHCRQLAQIPPPSLRADGYHTPAMYFYRNWPWGNGKWDGYSRHYPADENEDTINVSVANTNVVPVSTSDRTIQDSAQQYGAALQHGIETYAQYNEWSPSPNSNCRYQPLAHAQNRSCKTHTRPYQRQNEYDDE